MLKVVLKKGREKSLQRRHPWVFSGAIDKVEKGILAGQVVDVLSADGQFLARGAFSPESQITVRAWTFDKGEPVDRAFFERSIANALAMRRAMPSLTGTDAFRIVNAESDGLPGVVVDKYGDLLVCQFLSAGAEHFKGDIVAALSSVAPEKGIYERSDVDVRAKEGLEPRTGILSGDEPPELIQIKEGESKFLVDVRGGHKTGFYLDQRDNRAIALQFARDSEVLNCFSYTGGFGVAALAGGAKHVVNVDSSKDSLVLASQNFKLNGSDDSKFENVEADVFSLLRNYRDSRREFDMIVLDPPKFAESFEQVEKAARGYKDINLLAFKLLRQGGLLFTFSCSGHMKPELFQKVIADAALDAGRDAKIIARLSQSADHPTALNFPEGNYLKGLVCKL